SLHRLVALKMMLSGPFASPKERLRFQLEAELAARVQHSHIVRVYEVGAHEGRPFLAMEWVEGGSLADRLDGKPWPAAAAARAIHAAHAQGVIHRDLKPANILLQNNSTEGNEENQEGWPGAGQGRPSSSSLSASFPSVPKIADFGLARPAQGGKLTGTGITV